MEDTIAAISTPIGEGGIAIVRISGPRALAIADAVFVSVKGLPSTYPSHTIHFGWITGDKQQNLDEVLLSVMHIHNGRYGRDQLSRRRTNHKKRACAMPPARRPPR